MSEKDDYADPGQPIESFPPDDEYVPMKMTFYQELSEPESEEEFEEIELDMEIETEVDEDVKLIQALQNKALIDKKKNTVPDHIEKKRGTVPLDQYVSPNKSPRKKSPQKSPLHPADLRWVIEREKQRILELEIHEKMLKARKKLFEKEQSERESKKERMKRPKDKPEMPGLCGCTGLCKWYWMYGMCLNLPNYEDTIATSVIQPNPRDDLNNTI